MSKNEQTFLILMVIVVGFYIYVGAGPSSTDTRAYYQACRQMLANAARQAEDAWTASGGLATIEAGFERVIAYQPPTSHDVDGGVIIRMRAAARAGLEYTLEQDGEIAWLSKGVILGAGAAVDTMGGLGAGTIAAGGAIVSDFDREAEALRRFRQAVHDLDAYLVEQGYYDQPPSVSGLLAPP